jgi:hypothetical protein
MEGKSKKNFLAAMLHINQSPRQSFPQGDFQTRGGAFQRTRRPSLFKVAQDMGCTSVQAQGTRIENFVAVRLGFVMQKTAPVGHVFVGQMDLTAFLQPASAHRVGTL